MVTKETHHWTSVHTLWLLKVSLKCPRFRIIDFVFHPCRILNTIWLIWANLTQHDVVPCQHFTFRNIKSTTVCNTQLTNATIKRNHNKCSAGILVLCEASVRKWKWIYTYNDIPYLQNRCGHPWETRSWRSWGERERSRVWSHDNSLGELGHERREVFWET